MRVSAEGNRIVITFLLNAGSNLASATIELLVEELDNAEAIAYTRGRSDALSVFSESIDGFRLAFDGDTDAD